MPIAEIDGLTAAWKVTLVAVEATEAAHAAARAALRGTNDDLAAARVAEVAARGEMERVRGEVYGSAGTPRRGR